MSAESTPPEESGLPTREVLEAWLGHAFDFELRPGETLHVDSEAGALAARRFRDVLGHFATGITVVTSTSDGEPVGLTCQSFSSVSLDPPLVLFCPAKTSRAWPLIHASGHFCVNVLAADQVDVSDRMASRGSDKFAGIEWQPSIHTGSPVLAGSLAHVDCAIQAVHDGGDHHVVIGRVLDLAAGSSEAALTFFRGRYGSTS